jgi:hypothetical protein
LLLCRGESLLTGRLAAGLLAERGALDLGNQVGKAIDGFLISRVFNNYLFVFGNALLNI